MKLQMIYSFYIADNECNNKVYNLHYSLLRDISIYFDKITFIILYNESRTEDIVHRVKSKLIDIINCKDVTFITEQNLPEYREGIIYKKYIIDKLNDYDDYLTFFAHTKGVSNQDGLNNLNNLMLWIFSMYYFNIMTLYDVKLKLVDQDYITYGSLYFKDYRHNNINNWFYSGSFHWINTKKLYKYIKENNIDISKFTHIENERLKRCAELFIGSCLPYKYAAFYNDQIFNKEYELFHHYGWELSYTAVDEFLNAYLSIDEYNNIHNDFNNYISKINEN